MNKLNIPNGGMPFEGDDLMYMQDQLRDTFKAILKAFSPNNANFILQGLVVEGAEGSYSISAGYVVIDYEILFFPGVSDIDIYAEPAKAIGIEITYDPAGNEVFADQVSKDTYEVRRAKLKDVENVANEIKLLSSDAIRLGTHLSRLDDIFEEKALSIENGFVGYIRAWKFNKIVFLHGEITSPSSSFVNDIVATFPSSITPVGIHRFVIPARYDSNPNDLKFGVAEINLSGLRILHGEKHVLFSGISYFI